MVEDGTPSLAVITGGSAGIGLAAARALGTRGWDVLICSRSEEAGRAAESGLRAEGIDATWVHADVTDPDQIEHVADVAARHPARLAAWVNNAGRALVKDSLTITVDEWDDVFRTNVRSVFLGAQAAARIMIGNGGGVIVNVSSIQGLIGSPGRIAYTSSKHALEGLTKGLAVEWGRRGVRVVGIAPGYVDTELVRNLQRAGKFGLEQIVGRVPLGRIGTVEDVGGAIALLCSAELRYMNGTTLVLDGGYIAHGSFESLGPLPGANT
ncbi:MAG TPA: SDR family oxidoreductase [Ilumatobacteraceae bacterium]|nr:SDR family oxidoreductase [Ilumatobacteraceae bacterium]